MRKKSLRWITALLALCLLGLAPLSGIAEGDAIFPEDDAPAENAIFPETDASAANDAIFPEDDAPAENAIFPETDASAADDAIFPEDDDDPYPEEVTVTQEVPQTGLEVYYFSLERVDGILIRCDGATCFIDVGYHRDARKVLPYLKALGVEKLDCYIGTHAHADHIEGAPEIIYALRPDVVYVSHKQTWNAIVSYCSRENRSVVKDTPHKVLKHGQSFMLGGAQMLCLGPISLRSCNPGDNEENANSLICKLVYGARSFLFAGDCYDYNLEAVAKKYPGYLDSDVFQNPHHNGSHSDYVLDLVSPKAVVFSTDNTSLPRNDYLSRIREHKSVYFITGSYNDGNVLITSDGEHLEAYCGYPLSSVKLNPVDAMVPGQKVRMTGSLEPSRRANPKLLNWKSSNPEVVKVSKGTLTAVAEGTATITATAINGVSDSVEVQVSNTGVILNEHEISLNVGEAGQLKYKLTGDAVARGIEWISDDADIAMVTGDGEVIGVGVGETRVFARIESGAQAACVVTVTEKPVRELELNKSKIRLKVGETYALQCKVRPSDATDKRLEWASSDESIATVDAFGNVTAVGKGSAKIGVRASNGVYDLCKVKVE